MSIEHKYDKEALLRKKEARDNLETPHTPPNSIPALRDRLYEVEAYLGLSTIEEE